MNGCCAARRRLLVKRLPRTRVHSHAFCRPAKAVRARQFRRITAHFFLKNTPNPPPHRSHAARARRRGVRRRHKLKRHSRFPAAPSRTRQPARAYQLSAAATCHRIALGHTRCMRLAQRREAKKNMFSDSDVYISTRIRSTCSRTKHAT